MQVSAWILQFPRYLFFWLIPCLLILCLLILCLRIFVVCCYLLSLFKSLNANSENEEEDSVLVPCLPQSNSELSSIAAQPCHESSGRAYSVRDPWRVCYSGLTEQNFVGALPTVPGAEACSSFFIPCQNQFEQITGHHQLVA